MPKHRVRVSGIVPWLDARRLLGDGAWAFEAEGGRLAATAELDTAAACDLAARLRGVGIDGAPLVVELEPPAKRNAVRAARSEDAKRRRATSVGFAKQGARLDDEGRMSLTPQALAEKVARALPPDAKVIDAGCGAGGNAIAFARAGAAVTAIERDAGRLADARHNARLYGEAERISWHEGDALAYIDAQLESLHDTIVFVDPPWGADWDRTCMRASDFPLLGALIERRRHFGGLWAKLPPSFAAHEHPEAQPQALFGEAAGDRRRIKFVLLRW